MSKAVLILNNVHKTFQQGREQLDVLKGVSVTLNKGEVVALVGPSGAGKSTFLQIAGLLESPTTGEIEIDGEACQRASDNRRSRIRRDKIGFVYQSHNLLPEFSALENVALPQQIAGQSKKKAAERARDLLTRVGLAERLTHRPARLSGGEQQRVAIARALANNPKIVMADEPTGNLDSQTAELVFNELLTLARESDLALLIATHDRDLAARMDRVLTMRDGVLTEGLAAE